MAQRIDGISPDRIYVTSRGRARLRITGVGRGLLRCGDQTRWVWGAFDESFSLLVAGEDIAISLRGLGASCRARVAVALVCDLEPARTPGRPRRLARVAKTVRAPRLRVRTRRAPTLRRLALGKRRD